MEILQDPFVQGTAVWILALITFSLPFVPQPIKNIALTILTLGITKTYENLKKKSEQEKEQQNEKI